MSGAAQSCNVAALLRPCFEDLDSWKPQRANARAETRNAAASNLSVSGGNRGTRHTETQFLVAVCYVVPPQSFLRCCLLAAAGARPHATAVIGAAGFSGFPCARDFAGGANHALDFKYLPSALAKLCCLIFLALSSLSKEAKQAHCSRLIPNQQHLINPQP